MSLDLLPPPNKCLKRKEFIVIVAKNWLCGLSKLLHLSKHLCLYLRHGHDNLMMLLKRLNEKILSSTFSKLENFNFTDIHKHI